MRAPAGRLGFEYAGDVGIVEYLYPGVKYWGVSLIIRPIYSALPLGPYVIGVVNLGNFPLGSSVICVRLRRPWQGLRCDLAPGQRLRPHERRIDGDPGRAALPGTLRDVRGLLPLWAWF